MDEPGVLAAGELTEAERAALAQFEDDLRIAIRPLLAELLRQLQEPPTLLGSPA